MITTQDVEPNPVDAVVRSTEVQRACAEIRALLPQLTNLNTAFAELFELLDEHDLADNFDAACHQKFGIHPDLLRDAAEHP